MHEFGDRFDFGAVFPYRRGLIRESSKTFHFFPRHFLLSRAASLNRNIYTARLVRQVFQIVFAKVLSALSVGEFLRNRDAVA